MNKALVVVKDVNFYRNHPIEFCEDFIGHPLTEVQKKLLAVLSKRLKDKTKKVISKLRADIENDGVGIKLPN